MAQNSLADQVSSTMRNRDYLRKIATIRTLAAMGFVDCVWRDTDGHVRQVVGLCEIVDIVEPLNIVIALTL